MLLKDFVFARRIHIVHLIKATFVDPVKFLRMQGSALVSVAKMDFGKKHKKEEWNLVSYSL